MKKKSFTNKNSRNIKKDAKKKIQRNVTHECYT